ncbi:ER lumen protein retaining receptor family protein [Perilla frutescens var. frutescens]|nr:ER lumen protein retaining receptor family protein [Perilla frutescens var. frutescens]
MGSKIAEPLFKILAWVRRRSTKVKTLLSAAAALCALVVMKLLVKDHSHFFIASEAIHFVGILVLIYKLTTQKTCSGLSLKTQELTAIFLAARLCCSYSMEGDIHTVLDFLTLASTVWVIYKIRFKLKSTYIAKLDCIPLYYVAVPCAILAVLVHPRTYHAHSAHILWAFAVYLESVSVFPQLTMIQNAKIIEPFTAHYVFALGVARFLGCAYWIIRVYDSAGRYLFLVGDGYIWLLMMLLAEIIQTFILADFCYYYIKGVMDGRLIVYLPLSSGGKYGKIDNLREKTREITNCEKSDFAVLRCEFSGLVAENGSETIDPQRRREIQALRRQEARRKREEKVKKSKGQNAVGFVDDNLFLEAQKFQARVRDREIREKDLFFEGKSGENGKNCSDEVADELGLSLFSERKEREKECFYPKVQLVASPIDCDSEYSNGVKSLEQCSSAVSDYHAMSHKGGSSSDTGSQSSPLRRRDSWSQAEADGGLGGAKLVPKRNPQASWMRSDADNGSPVSSTSEALSSKETCSGLNDKPPPNPSAAAAAACLPRMPCVSATGNGPNGRTVTGFLYRYNKTEVSIMCVCHGTSFSPAEFVAHAGSVDVTHPLRHITVVPSALQ